MISNITTFFGNSIHEHKRNYYQDITDYQLMNYNQYNNSIG